MLTPLGELEQALWATAFYAGLRRGELRALRARDVNLDEATGTITVERGWDTIEGPIAPKSVAGFRTVFLADTLRPYIAPFVERLDGNPDHLVFGSGTEAPFEPKNVSRKAAAAWKAENLERAEEAAKTGADPELINPITLHEARHSFSTSGPRVDLGLASRPVHGSLLRHGRWSVPAPPTEPAQRGREVARRVAPSRGVGRQDRVAADRCCEVAPSGVPPLR